MNKLGKLASIKLIAILSMIVLIHPVVYAEKLGSITAQLSYANGDRAYTYVTSSKIYQDFNKNPYREIESVSENPFDIASLPLNHQYKIEVYVNGIIAGMSYVNLQTEHQDVDIKILSSGGMRVSVFYNDGQTPISDALAEIMTQDNRTWGTSPTDIKGQTTRFWLTPTTNEETYTVNVKIGRHLSFYYPSVSLPSGMEEVKIVTPWPPLINTLITVKLYTDQFSSITPSDGKFMVDAIDDNGKKAAESKVNNHGEAYLSNLKVGDYLLQAVEITDNYTWPRYNVTLDGITNNLIILNHKAIVLTSIKNETSGWSQNKISNSVFLGDIQYLLKNKLLNATSTSESKGIPNWFKSNANWWSAGIISDSDFLNGIQFLIDKG